MITVYTSIIGNIDRLWSVPAAARDAKHVAFVDSPKEEFDMETRLPVDTPVWEQRLVEPRWNNRRTARHYKTAPHRYLDGDVWIWVDGNVRLLTSPRKIVDELLVNDFATLKHPDRSCVYQELHTCRRLRGVVGGKKEDYDAQEARYREEAMPAMWGLAETRVFIRRNNELMRKFGEAWWYEIENYSLRDQIGLPYVCWKMSIRWDELPGQCRGDNRSPHWCYIPHGL